MGDLLQFRKREPEDEWVMSLAVFRRAVDGQPFVMLTELSAVEVHTDETTRARGIRLADTLASAAGEFRVAMEKIDEVSS